MPLLSASSLSLDQKSSIPAAALPVPCHFLQTVPRTVPASALTPEEPRTSAPEQSNRSGVGALKIAALRRPGVPPRPARHFASSRRPDRLSSSTICPLPFSGFLHCFRINLPSIFPNDSKRRSAQNCHRWCPRGRAPAFGSSFVRMRPQNTECIVG